MKYNNLEKWVVEQWQESNFGDKRRNRRAIKLGTSLLNKPNASLPAQTEKWSILKASYRILNSPSINHKNVQEIHWKKTINKTSNNQVTLFLQDTSELDYSSKKKVSGLGPIGNHRGKGIMLHSCLAIEYAAANINVLGLAHQQIWCRDNMSHRKSESRKQRLSRKNEGDLWENSLEEISTFANQVKDNWISVGDRGNDIFSFIRFCKNSSWHYVIRAKHNRIIICKDGKKSKLIDYARKFESEAIKKIKLQSKEEVNLDVGWGKIKISTPRNYFKITEYEEIDACCIRCWNDEAKLEWILLTNVTVNNVYDALEKIDWYKARWLIEEYHKCLKTGCQVEKRNLQTAGALQVLLGFFGILATKLLEIKFIAKKSPKEFAKLLIEPLILKVICLRFHIPENSITVKQFWHCIAQMGGFIGRKSDGDPGWQTTWKGWLRVLDMVNAIKSIAKCG